MVLKLKVKNLAYYGLAGSIKITTIYILNRPTSIRVIIFLLFHFDDAYLIILLQIVKETRTPNAGKTKSFLVVPPDE